MLEPSFPAAAFQERCLPAVVDGALKERVAAIADALFAAFALPIREAAPFLLALAGPEADEPGQTRFDPWPMLTIVERHGLQDPDASLDLMVLLTRRFSAEFAIRPFLQHHPDRTWARLRTWVIDPSPHVRRLVSEGTRPRLPWAQQVPSLILDPGPGLEVAGQLRSDPHDNVRNSLANHLNDVAKDHPERVLALVRAWSADGGPGRERLVKQALRTLVKRGVPEALALVGGGSMIEVRGALSGPTTLPSGGVPWGGTLELRGTLSAETRGSVVADWILEVPGARGPRRKVFKGAVLDLEPGLDQTLRFRLVLVPRSTRPLSPGPVRVALQVDGREIASYTTELLPPS